MGGGKHTEGRGGGYRRPRHRETPRGGGAAAAAAPTCILASLPGLTGLPCPGGPSATAATAARAAASRSPALLPALELNWSTLMVGRMPYGFGGLPRGGPCGDPGCTAQHPRF